MSGLLAYYYYFYYYYCYITIIIIIIIIITITIIVWLYHSGCHQSIPFHQVVTRHVSALAF